MDELIVYYNTGIVDFELRCVVVKLKPHRTHCVNPPRAVVSNCPCCELEIAPNGILSVIFNDVLNLVKCLFDHILQDKEFVNVMYELD